jgi:hypothetical protein
MEEFLLPRLGIYPWECVICRVRKYFRDDGKRPASAEAAELFREVGIKRAEDKAKS